MELFDCVIIGGGYAGISAGIYLARYNRTALIIDKGDGRWDTNEFNENYLGFEKGILTRELHQRGLKQALYFGAKFQGDEIEEIKKENNIFNVLGNKENYQAKTIILATGVYDLFPHFPRWKDYLGCSLFWCITCDGFKTRDKTVMVVGATDDAAITALQFLNFTEKIILVTNAPPGKEIISQRRKDYLKEVQIPIYKGVIKQVFGKKGLMEKVKLDTGEEIATDFMFNQQGAVPKSELGKKMGIKTDGKGYIVTDFEQRTNIPLVYAAGDVTRPFAHQIITAAHEGSVAAESANYDLYLPFQKAN